MYTAISNVFFGILSFMKNLPKKIQIENDVSNAVDSGDTEPTILIYDNSTYIKTEE